MNTSQSKIISLFTNRLWFIFLMLPWACASAQSVDPTAVSQAPTIEGSVLVLPLDAHTSGEVLALPETRISIAVEGDFRVYRARHKGKDHMVHVALDGPKRRLAFDPSEGRFRDILPSLRVEMDHFGEFEALVRAAGGTGGKVYEALGYGLILLPEDKNPADVAAELNALPNVVSATIQLQGPLYVPM